MEKDLVTPIENSAQLQQVWSICHPEKPVPEVDFDRTIVCIVTRDAGDHNGVGRFVYLKPEGTLQCESITALVAYPPTDITKVEFYLVNLT